MLDSKIVKEFEDRGFVILRGFLDKELIRRVREEYDRSFQENEFGEIPKDIPIAVLWTHVVGGRKKIRHLSTLPELQRLALDSKIAPAVKELASGEALRLLETIIFNKPPKEGGKLQWHQDVSYFPFDPNNQLAVWIPFDVVTKDNGALNYVVGSHKGELRGSVDLHSGKKFTNEEREPIPDDPTQHGYEVQCCEVEPGDMIIHDGRTWHMSGPNTMGAPRRAVSLRYLIGKTVYVPRPGSAASFMAQVDVKPGDEITGAAFPVVG